MDDTKGTDKRYIFKEIRYCEMCNDITQTHKILGQRLNKSQGFNPKNKRGISVSIIKCNNCGLIYSNPQPIPFDLQDHYGTPPEEYWKEEYFTWSPKYFKPQIEKAITHIGAQKEMKALDIGAGIGKAMLSMVSLGFDAYGLEPSIPFYERAISKMGIKADKLKLGSIEELEYDKETFDFITFGAVFEHLYEPSKCLEKALTWLKPNGVLHIEVPSADWLMPKIMNLYFRLRGTNYVTNLSPMHAPYHLHEFTLKSFTELSRKLSFDIVESYYEVCTIYHIPKIFHGLLRMYMQKTNKGMQLTVFLKKKK